MSSVVSSLESLARKSAADVAEDFSSSLDDGLSTDAVNKALLRYGENRVGDTHVLWWHILLRQCASPFIYLLVVAALLALILGEAIDATIIFLFLAINAVLGFIEEYRSERTVEFLRRFTAHSVKVLRGKKRVIVSADVLVPGDIIFLETGDRVPADARLFDSQGVFVDESILTGESSPATKKAHGAISDTRLPETIVFAGTTVVAGMARAIVVRTGPTSMFGEIATLTSETVRTSGFEKGVSRFSSFILKLVLVTITFVFVANIFIKGEGANIGSLVLFSIALAVGVIPEALPVVTTFSLSRGARKLARQKVIVKRLSAIEDLGGIEVLCTDKTGTITENVLSLGNVYPGSSPEYLMYANLSGAEQFGARLAEPFDVALRRALPASRRAELSSWVRVREVPFDPDCRMNAVHVRKTGRKLGAIIIRGAPESVVALCTLTESEKKSILAFTAEAGRSGRRVLAVAYRAESSKDSSRDLYEGKFEFTGVGTFADPIKSTTKYAVSEAQKLGVAIKIITGDSPEVAGAVAFEIGLVTSPDHVLTGSMFEQLSHEKKIVAVQEHAVFARISPRQKHEIIKLLQERFSVGFLGEGINDAPALKSADVSLAVSSAADIAKEAADIILLKKSLHVIIDGIREGRSVFSNTVKYIRATLASNFGNFYTVAVVSLFVDFLPMLPIQILLLNLLSDVPMITIATDRVDAVELKEPSRYNVKDIVWIATVLGIVSTVFDFILFSLFYRSGEAVLQTNWFLGSLLTELVFVFSIRTMLPFYRATLPSFSIIVLTLIASITAVVLPFTGWGQTIFHFVPPTLSQLSLIVLVVILYFISTEVVKLLIHRTRAREHLIPSMKLHD